MRPIATERAPAAIGPYAQAVVTGGMVFCSGQIPLDPTTGAVVPGGVRAQTERALRNLEAVLEAAGTSLARVAKVTVYLRDLDDFAEMNAIYAERFGEHRPARAAVEVSRLPRDVLVEVDAIAALPE